MLWFISRLSLTLLVGLESSLEELWDKLEATYTQHRTHRKLRHDVIAYLGGPRCARCGYSNETALSVDHIHNDGAEERKIENTYTTYRRILRGPREEMLENYQVLCRNCNWLKEQERVERELKARRTELRTKIHEYEEMEEHYRRLELPFGLDL